LKASAIATNFTFCLLINACMAAPVPRPPQPTTATLISSDAPEKSWRGKARVLQANLLRSTKNLLQIFCVMHF